MKYLLDVNILLALGNSEHVHNERVLRWLSPLLRDSNEPTILETCAITELGFVRVASGPAGWCANVDAAKRHLRRLKVGRPFTFVPDGIGVRRLPDWVTQSKHVMDGHLLQLAWSNGSQLATLDERIPGALVVPKLGDEDLMVREPTVHYGTAA